MIGRDPAPQVAAVRSSNTLCRTVTLLVRWLDARSSVPRMLTPPAACRIRLYWNVMRWVTAHGALPFWLRGVMTIG